jgi:predicted tellurium resistance membrane protein TerC
MIKVVRPMNKTGWIGIVLAIYGVIVLIGAAAACPAKHASISMSIFMILTGVAFALLGKDIEKPKEAK